jgi:hypothetical protein
VDFYLSFTAAPGCSFTNLSALLSVPHTARFDLNIPKQSTLTRNVYPIILFKCDLSSLYLRQFSVHNVCHYKRTEAAGSRSSLCRGAHLRNRTHDARSIVPLRCRPILRHTQVAIFYLPGEQVTCTICTQNGYLFVYPCRRDVVFNQGEYSRPPLPPSYSIISKLSQDMEA